MDMHRLLRGLATGVLLLTNAVQGFGAENELCAPFRDGQVEQTLVKSMLSAAEDGHLYRIKTATSRVGFCVESEFTRVRAEFLDFQGGLSLWPDPGEAEQVLVVINAASLDTDGSIIEHMLKSTRFFDVENYPQILFVSTGIIWSSPTTAELQGNLTLHGVTRAVIFKVELVEVSDTPGEQVERIVAKAGTTIRRSDFGMDGLSTVVSDTVDLCMSVEAVRYRG